MTWKPSRLLCYYFSISVASSLLYFGAVFLFFCIYIFSDTFLQLHLWVLFNSCCLFPWHCFFFFLMSERGQCIWLSVDLLFQLQQSLFRLRSPSLGLSAPPPSSPAKLRASLSPSSPGWRMGRFWSLGDTSNSGTTTGNDKSFTLYFYMFISLRFIKVKRK